MKGRLWTTWHSWIRWQVCQTGPWDSADRWIDSLALPTFATCSSCCHPCQLCWSIPNYMYFTFDTWWYHVLKSCLPVTVQNIFTQNCISRIHWTLREKQRIHSSDVGSLSKNYQFHETSSSLKSGLKTLSQNGKKTLLGAWWLIYMCITSQEHGTKLWKGHKSPK